MKCLRGTPLDIFGYAAHRRQERALIDWYRDLIEQVMAKLDGRIISHWPSKSPRFRIRFADTNPSKNKTSPR